MGMLAQQMIRLLADNVKDPELHAWVMPQFSTTPTNDTVVASVIMMGQLQKYFSYEICLVCGIPSVTLLGEKEDWTEILWRLDKLPGFGTEPEAFARLLKPVVSCFVKSFDEPEGKDVKDFWSKIAHESGGSGPCYLSGWITALCFWVEDGNSIYHGAGADGPKGSVQQEGFGPYDPGCQLGETLYHKVNTDNIPSGFVSVPVTVDDNGTVYKTRMVAGSLRIRVCSSGGLMDEGMDHATENYFHYDWQMGVRVPSVYRPAEPTREPGLDSVSAEAGWFMYELKGEDEGGAGKGDALEQEFAPNGL